MVIHYCGNAITIAGTLLTSVYIYGKSTKSTISAKLKMLSVLWCLLWALLCTSNLPWISPMFIRVITCTAFVVFISRLYDPILETAVSAYLLSYGISYSLLYIATFLIGITFAPFLSAGYANDALFEFNDFISLLSAVLVVILQFILAYLLFRIRRFRNGFPFIFGKYAVVIALIVAGIVLAFVSLIAAPRESYYESIYKILLFIIVVVIVGTGIYFWIRRGIAMFQWRKTMLHNIELLEQELDDEKEKNRQLTDKLDIIRVANHKILRRLEAMEYKVVRQNGAEFSGDVSITLRDVQKLQREYQDDVARVKGSKPLPSVKIKEIDNLFEYFAAQFADSNIDFSLKVIGSIPFMVEHVIPKGKLETLIGDHLQNALIAVNASENSFRSVWTVIGLAGDCYEFKVYDSGIPFEVNTLVRLGTERITTHADTDGSGIGFMTTFETMREYGASLLISEKKSGGADYTKSVAIRFDEKKHYIIETYRSDDFPAQDDRYVVVGV